MIDGEVSNESKIRKNQLEQMKMVPVEEQIPGPDEMLAPGTWISQASGRGPKLEGGTDSPGRECDGENRHQTAEVE